jgi:hypothetical protein
MSTLDWLRQVVHHAGHPQSGNAEGHHPASLRAHLRGHRRQRKHEVPRSRFLPGQNIIKRFLFFFVDDRNGQLSKRQTSNAILVVGQLY